LGNLRSQESEIAKDFYRFLLNFYSKYPQFKGQALYLTGESFAGHYIPAIANFLHTSTEIKISGLAIGNGWVDPIYQYPAYAEFAAENGVISAGHA